MKKLLLSLIGAFSLFSIQAQDDAFKMEPESPSMIGKISFISPMLFAEVGSVLKPFRQSWFYFFRFEISHECCRRLRAGNNSE